MNDPMEGIYQSSRLLQDSARYKETVNRIRDQKSGLGIACFSETYENMIMWAHYAGNFKGICLGYSSEDLIEGLPSTAALIRVAYLDKPPTVDGDPAVDMQTTAKRILSQKQYNWSYEREWRVLAPFGRLNYVRAQALQEIYLGIEIPQVQRKLLIDSVAGMDLRVYEMNFNGYTPLWDEVPISKTRPSRTPKRRAPTGGTLKTRRLRRR
jgi:hypothetical protein